MRETSFKGKRKDNGEWVCGDLIHRRIWSQDIYIIRVSDSGFDTYEEYEVIPETTCEFAGLLDKNNKKIYEGDIVKVMTTGDTLRNSYSGIAVIKFDCNNGRFIAKGTLDYPLNSKYIWEIIGNVHDNPELLEEKR